MHAMPAWMLYLTFPLLELLWWDCLILAVLFHVLNNML